MCCVLRSSIACALPSALYLSCFASPALSVDAGFFITSSLALHLSRFISLRCVVWRLVSALCLSCFASPALSVDTGFFITSSLALHLSRFILCAVSFGALSLHFAFRALPPLRYQSTPDSSSLCLSCFASPALSVDAGFFITSSLALHLSRFISLCCVVWRLASCISSLSFLLSIIAPRVGHFPNRPFLSIIAFAATHLPCRLYKIMSTFHCEIRLCLFRAFGSPPECARPSSGQAPLSL